MSVAERKTNCEIKSEMIKIRIEKEKKDNWKKLCLKRKITFTSLILNSVEGRLMDDERRKVVAFIEKQDNLFVKIETNINQVARIANSQKFISEKELNEFNKQLVEIEKLKEQQNEVFTKIYSFLGK